MPESFDHTTTSFKSTDPQIHFHQKLTGSYKVFFVALVSLLLILGVAYTNHRYGNLLTDKLGQKSTSGTVKVSLLDAFSGQVISNVAVRVYSDNGIRCFQAPCNTEVQEWHGRSDNNGFVFIPSKIINKVTTISATGYKAGRDLNKDSEKIADNYWVIELDPDSKIDNFERRLKLVDSQTQKPISNILVWITNSQNCQPPECADYSFGGETNKLGNVYYPASTIKDNSWILVKGYKSKRFPVGWVNFKVSLDKAAESGGESPPEPPEEGKPQPQGVEISCQEQQKMCKYTNRDYGFSIEYSSNLEVTGGIPEKQSIHFARKETPDKDEFRIEKNFKGGWMGRSVKQVPTTVDGVPATVELWVNCSPGASDTEAWVECNKNLSLASYDTASVIATFTKNQDKWYLFSKSWLKGELNPDQEIQKVISLFPSFRFLDQKEAGRKSYTNNPYNYSFQYPEKWSLKVFDDFQGANKPASRVEVSSGVQTFGVYIDPAGFGGEAQELVETKKITVGGLPATEGLYRFQDIDVSERCSKGCSHYIHVQKGQTDYLLTYVYTSKAGVSSSEALFQQILLTLRFLD